MSKENTNQLTIDGLIKLRHYFEIKRHQIKSDAKIIKMIDWCIDSAELIDALPIADIDKCYLFCQFRDFRDLFLCYRDEECKEKYFIECKIKLIQGKSILIKLIKYYEINLISIEDGKFIMTQREHPFCDKKGKFR